MLCLSINEQSFKKIKILVSQFDFYELRLDLCKVNPIQVGEILQINNNCIITPFEEPVEYREHLKMAAMFGAKYIDLPYADNYKDHIPENLNKTEIILSHHFTDKTDKNEIFKMADKMKSVHSGFMKLVNSYHNKHDIINILQLYEKFDDLIAFCRGEEAKLSRMLALKLGCPFIYTALYRSNRTSEGQFLIDELERFPELWNE